MSKFALGSTYRSRLDVGSLILGGCGIWAHRAWTTRRNHPNLTLRLSAKLCRLDLLCLDVPITVNTQVFGDGARRVHMAAALARLLSTHSAV